MRRLLRELRRQYIGLLALFVALGGASYAVATLPANSVGSAQIRKNAVTSRKVKNRSLLARDFKPGQLPDGKTGAMGERGPAGATGEPGPTASAFSQNAHPVPLAISAEGTVVNQATIAVSSQSQVVANATAQFETASSPVSCFLSGSSDPEDLEARWSTPAVSGEPQSLALVGGKTVPAGTYTVYLLCARLGPGPDEYVSGDLALVGVAQ